MSNVAVGLNGKIGAPDAARILKCSMGTVLNLIKRGKLDCQKVPYPKVPLGFRYVVDANEVYRLRDTHAVKHKPKKAQMQTHKKSKSSKRTAPDRHEPTRNLTLQVEAGKYEVLNRVLKSSGQSLEKLMLERFNELYARVEAKMRDIRL